jgi:hypothetical protein
LLLLVVLAAEVLEEVVEDLVVMLLDQHQCQHHQ